MLFFENLSGEQLPSSPGKIIGAVAV